MNPKSPLNGGAGGNGLTAIASLDTVLLKDLQNLVHHCSVTRYSGGEPREPGWFVVRTLGTIWQVSLKDPDSCLQLAAVGLTVDEALTTADLLLSSDNGPWELDRYLERRPGRKPKKQS